MCSDVQVKKEVCIVPEQPLSLNLERVSMTGTVDRPTINAQCVTRLLASPRGKREPPLATLHCNANRTPQTLACGAFVARFFVLLDLFLGARLLKFRIASLFRFQLSTRARNQVEQKRLQISALSAGVSPEGQNLYMAIARTIKQVRGRANVTLCMKLVSSHLKLARERQSFFTFLLRTPCHRTDSR